VTSWWPSCDWHGCRARATRYLQLGYRKADLTKMWVCDDHYLLGAEYLQRTGQGRKLPIGTVTLQSIFEER
jgi:hypothetical protein